MDRLIIVLVLLAVVQLVACGVLLGPPWRHMDKLIAWLVVSVGGAFLALFVLLALSLFDVHIPTLVGVLVLAGLNASVGWVLALLVRARLGSRDGRNSS